MRLNFAGVCDEVPPGASDTWGDPAFPQGFTKISAIKASVDLYATDSDDEEVQRCLLQIDDVMPPSSFQIAAMEERSSILGSLWPCRIASSGSSRNWKAYGENLTSLCLSTTRPLISKR